MARAVLELERTQPGPNHKPNSIPQPRPPHHLVQPSALPHSIRHFRFNAPPSAEAVDERSRRSTASSSAPLELNANLSLSPVVLAVTVDGHVHALNRETGQWLWTLHDDGGAAAGGWGSLPGTSAPRRSPGASIGGPLVKSRSRRQIVRDAQADSSWASTSRAGANETALAVGEGEVDDEVYVIEPAGAGSLFLYTRKDGVLQKLPMSMQELVNLEALTFPFDDSRMFVGKKESNLVGVDLRTGRLVGVFGSGNGWCEWDPNKAGTVQREECDEDISRRPEDLLYMARTEYHLSVYAKSSSALLQQLTYTTYASSTPSSTVWASTPDDRYLQSWYEGSLLCFKVGETGVQWQVQFDGAPVMTIFDLAIDTTSGPRAQPLMFEQPHLLPPEFEGLRKEEQSTYLGRVGDELFAMSRERFPLVEFAPQAGGAVPIGGRLDAPSDQEEEEEEEDEAGEEAEVQVGDEDEVEVDDEMEENEDICRGIDCLVGQHPLLPSPRGGTLDPPQSYPLIDGAPGAERAPPEAQGPTQPRQIPVGTPYPHLSSHKPTQSTLGPFKALSQGSPEATLVMAIIIAVLGYLYARRVWTSKTQKAVEDRIALMRSEWIGSQTNGQGVPYGLAELPLPPLPDRNQTQTPPDANGPELGSPRSSDLSSPPPSPALTNSTAASTPALQPGFSSSAGPSPSSSPKRARAQSVSHLKDLPPIPAAHGGDDGEAGAGEDGDSDGEQKEGDGDSTPRKKGRRRRGKKQKKSALGAVKLGDESAVVSGAATPVVSVTGPNSSNSDGGDKELGAIVLTEADVKEEIIPDVEDAASGAVIGGLAVSETILGYGSHGTVVLRGEFQGRAVAVKRLLKDFVTIATHEVALLQESDDHPHVIRYFCKEQRDTFLYIALELCPASLFDLIDQPSTFPELVDQLESKKALKQITSGIRHLHKLKIVHRDIKPQNILVSAAKHGGVRMLISDFGLCKKLDMDESSFQQTVNHAAGSFGYRAPEVLRGQVDPDAIGVSGAGSNGGSTLGSPAGSTIGSGGGGGLMTDPAMRLTRSIDIFSLGCIFYYVLTGGEHPFGGRYEREMNILQGKISLESLDGLGEEAVEAQDLITRMVANDPRQRPTAESVLLHPFFWNPQKRLLFICDASDRFEILERDPPAPPLVTLESHARSIVGDDWQKALDRTFLDNLGKYRKYEGRSVRDLLRVLRNKKHHYQDLPLNVQQHLGSLPAGFLGYFTSRFPGLLLCVYETVRDHFAEELMFQSSFTLPGEGEE